MHPVLFKITVPASWVGTFGPKSAIFGRWQLLLLAFIVGAVAAMWASGPDQPEERRWMVWVGGLLALAAGLPLAGVGLVKIGEIKLHTYGVMISMGFLCGIALAARATAQAGDDPELMLDFAFWVLVSAIVGSRVMYIITTPQEYVKDPSKLLRLWEGGLVFYGGLLACLMVAIWFVRKHKISFWRLSDLAIPSVALGQAFGRMGCFAAGCCYGKNVPGYDGAVSTWAVKFSTGLAPKGVFLHPTQLYEATANLTIFFILVAIRSRKKYDGQALVWYLFLYPIARFTIEMFRGDKIRGYLFEVGLIDKLPGPDLLTTSQIVSIVLFTLGLFSMAYLNRQNQKQLA